MTLRLLGVLGLLMIALTACGQGAPPSSRFSTVTPTIEEPTAVLTPTQTGTPVPFARPTLPPTWTPTAIPTDGPSPTPYTPVGAITATPYSEFNINLNGDGSYGNVGTAPPGCGDYGPDTSRTSNSVAAGSTLTVYWTSTVRRVFYFEVQLHDSTGEVLDSTRATPSTRSYRFGGRHFEGNSVYSWSVTPYNSSGDPICPPRSMDIRVTQG